MTTEIRLVRRHLGLPVYEISVDGQTTELPAGVVPEVGMLKDVLADGTSGSDSDVVARYLTALCIKDKIDEIDHYDCSTAVNSFLLDGMEVWLDKATRVGLMNSLNCEKQAGHIGTTLWLGTMPIALDVDLAIQLLTALELYALECFAVTAQHKAAVEALTDWQAVEAYDHTTGYPPRPVIDTKA